MLVRKGSPTQIDDPGIWALPSFFVSKTLVVCRIGWEMGVYPPPGVASWVCLVLFLSVILKQRFFHAQSRWLLSTSIGRAFCFNPCRPLRNGSVPSARWSFLRLRQSVPSRGHPAGKHNSRGALVCRQGWTGGLPGKRSKSGWQDTGLDEKTLKKRQQALVCLFYHALSTLLVDCVCAAICKEFEKTSALVFSNCSGHWLNVDTDKIKIAILPKKFESGT